MFTLDELLTWFSVYAYQPEIVYLAVVLLMFGSSFGLPIPEELTLISLGLLCYTARHPEQFSSVLSTGANPVNTWTAAAVAFFAVFISDLVVFFLGKHFGTRLLKLRMFHRMEQIVRGPRITSWVGRYGAWAGGIFRFTPGLRFPGHFACGMLGVSTWKFVLVDGSAALLSVPTQVLLIAYYGETVLVHFKQFKFGLGSLLLVFVVFYLSKKLWLRFRAKAGAS
jgi:membrane protein DedA with SNARE-associated domain